MRAARATPAVVALLLLGLPGGAGGHVRATESAYLIVFESARVNAYSQIFTVVPEQRGKESRRLPPIPANSTSPSVSPQTGEVAVSLSDGTRWQIEVVASDGTRRAVGSPQRTNADPVLSPDGERIAFESNHGGNWDIDVAFADGSKLQRLTRNKAADFDPAWSPDGSKIVFSRIGRRGPDIYEINVQSRFVRRLTRTAAPEFDPNWSPDGKLIVFDRLLNGDYDLWTMNPNGKDQKRLTTGAGNDVDPVWSPDSRQIAFQSDRTGDYDIFIVKSGGSTVANVSSNPTALDVEPSWTKASTGESAHDDVQMRRLATGGAACTKPLKIEKSGKKTRIYGTDENDFLCGEPGQDILYGARGRDYVAGGNGSDRIFGGLNGDYIIALDGTRDQLFGGRGDHDDSKLDRAWMDKYKKGDVNVKQSVDVVSP